MFEKKKENKLNKASCCFIPKTPDPYILAEGSEVEYGYYNNQHLFSGKQGDGQIAIHVHVNVRSTQ